MNILTVVGGILGLYVVLKLSKNTGPQTESQESTDSMRMELYANTVLDAQEILLVAIGVVSGMTLSVALGVVLASVITKRMRGK